MITEKIEKKLKETEPLPLGNNKKSIAAYHIAAANKFRKAEFCKAEYFSKIEQSERVAEDLFWPTTMRQEVLYILLALDSNISVAQKYNGKKNTDYGYSTDSVIMEQGDYAVFRLMMIDEGPDAVKYKANEQLWRRMRELTEMGLIVHERAKKGSIPSCAGITMRGKMMLEESVSFRNFETLRNTVMVLEQDENLPGCFCDDVWNLKFVAHPTYKDVLTFWLHFLADYLFTCAMVQEELDLEESKRQADKEKGLSVQAHQETPLEASLKKFHHALREYRNVMLNILSR